MDRGVVNIGSPTRLGRWKGVPSPAEIGGLSFIGPWVYVTAQSPTDRTDQYFLAKFDRHSRVWSRIDSADSRNGNDGIILGTDSGSLVLGRLPELRWGKPR